MKQPRLAELVASALRDEIVDGIRADGDQLPPLDVLVRQFGVSPPSIREALRILEHEGLITVRRGSLGGAVVHTPTAGAAAYTIGIVLQSLRIRASDLVTAMAELEPLFAALCAGRPDRHTAVVPVLRDGIERSKGAVEDPATFSAVALEFHQGIIDLCGNETVRLVGGALGALWRAQEVSWNRRIVEMGESPGVERLRGAVAFHEAVVDAIERGDRDAAAALMREHTAGGEIYGAKGRNPRIMATGLQPREFGDHHGNGGVSGNGAR